MCSAQRKTRVQLEQVLANFQARGDLLYLRCLARKDRLQRVLRIVLVLHALEHFVHEGL